MRCRRCGFCCQMDVKLYKEDIERLGEGDYHEEREGETFLKKKDGFCVFHKDKLCTVYDRRPDICRQFPIESDGSISPKCRTRTDFAAKVDQSIIKFMVQEGG